MEKTMHTDEKIGESRVSNKKEPVVYRKSSRVILRPVLADDVPTILRWINDPEVNQFLGTRMPMMEADEQDWFNNLHTRKPKDFVLAVIADSVIIGVMGIHNVDWRSGTATTGAMIGEKAYWNRGYGTEAKMLLLDFAFNTLNLRKIRSSVIEYNTRSYAYSLKCGYTEEGRLKGQHVSHGRCWDEIILAVFRKDWVELWKGFAKENNISIPEGFS